MTDEIRCPNCGAVIELDGKHRDALVSQVRDAELARLVDERMALAERDAQQRVALAEAAVRQEMSAQVAAKDAELLAAGDRAALEVERAVAALERRKAELVAELDRAKLESELNARSIREQYEARLSERDEAIERLRDMKLQLSTKMVGESLEKHCEAEFERVRAMAFPTATFEKDNDVVNGTKGDFVFRDTGDDGVEYVSIMFEMKNESLDGTSQKHRNDEFFAKLDRDRKNKRCEYAVLVSMLEPDSDLYNAGIVDVSHRFPKMFVVRPQFFVPILSLIRNSSRQAVDARAEVARMRSQQVDLARFEDDLAAFQEAFGKNAESSGRHLATSIETLDRVIALMQKTRDDLVTAQRQLRLANDKAQAVSIRRLTKDNPTMAARFGHGTTPPAFQ